MAFVVEDGNGLSTATSYVSDTDADAYFADHGDPATWTSASMAEKQTALILGTQYIDVTYVKRWQGWRKVEAQSLAWPRYNVTDYDGYSVDENSVPQRVKDAAAEAALRSLEGDELLPDQSGSNVGITREKVKAGPVERDVTYGGTKTVVPSYPIIEGLLKPLLKGGKNLLRA